MNEMSCDRLHELAPELALDILTGQQRADALAHLERCAGCRDHVTALTTIGDNLLTLVPGQEPPSGFETRVLERLRPAVAARRWRRRLLATAAAAVLVAGAGLGGWVAGVATHHEPPPAPAAAPQQHLRTGTFTTTAGAGQVFVYTGKPPWVYMAIDTDHATANVTCQLERADGSFVTIGTFPLDHGYGHWAEPLRIDPATVTAARVLATDGTIIATTHFTS